MMRRPAGFPGFTLRPRSGFVPPGPWCRGRTRLAIPALLTCLAAAGGCNGSPTAAHAPADPLPPGPPPPPASPEPNPAPGDRTPIPSGPPLPVGLAEISTTLDFDHPPLSGRLRIGPLEGRILDFAIDLDGDGLSDQAGPVGLGVAVAYLYREPGPREIAVAVKEANRWFRADRIVVVNDPDAIQISDSVRFFDIFPEEFSGVAFDPAGDVLYVSTGGQDRREIVALRSTSLKVLWRLSLAISGAQPFGGEGTGLALNGDRTILYADTGDSIEAVSVLGEPQPLGVVGPGDAGISLVLGDDGFLYSGGPSGIARIDPGSGRVIARRDAVLGGSISLSPGSNALAFLESTFRCRVLLLDARGLDVLWAVEDLFAGLGDCISLAFSPRGDALYVLARRDDLFLAVLEAATGAVRARMKLAEGDRGSRSPGASSPSTALQDGRYVAFATEVGLYVIDTETHLPAYALTGLAADRALGCCNLAPLPAGLFVAGWDLVTRLSFAP